MAASPPHPPATVNRRCRFAIISDPHVTLPHTVWNHPARPNLVEVSIPVLEQIFEHLEAAQIDFLLMPGDLTQHGERDNHRWLVERLGRLPFPTYVIPGNHDFPPFGDRPRINQAEFIERYRKFGYQDTGELPYYNREIFPGIRLIGLNSNQLSADRKRIDGTLDATQRAWLEEQLETHQADPSDPLLLVMVHHNIAEHIPHQATHPLGKRYILPEAQALQQKFRAAGVNAVFTGHLHVQDIVDLDGFHAITTGSLISYPHPYRICNCYDVGDRPGDRQRWLEITSHTVRSLPDWPDLETISWDWSLEHSRAFMTQLLAKSPLGLSLKDAKYYSREIRSLWANVSAGDRTLSFPTLPQAAKDYCEEFGVQLNQSPIRFCANHIALRLD